MTDDDLMSGLYPFLSEPTASDVEMGTVLAEVRESTLRKCRDIVELRQAVFAGQLESIIDAAMDLGAAFAGGGKLLAFGNGGSATDAQDAAADCMMPPVEGWRAVPALSLVDDVGTLTGVANDVGFESVFVRQVIAFGERGDVALGFSTSGHSGSVLAALAEAKRLGLVTIGLTGYDGGAIGRSGVCDHSITAHGEYVPRIQEAHATVWHVMLELAQMRLMEG